LSSKIIFVDGRALTQQEIDFLTLLWELIGPFDYGTNSCGIYVEWPTGFYKPNEGEFIVNHDCTTRHLDNEGVEVVAKHSARSIRKYAEEMVEQHGYVRAEVGVDQ